MKKTITLLLCVCFVVITQAQKIPYGSLGFFSTQSDMPFGRFAGMFRETLHPGIEITTGKITRHKAKHDYFAEWRLSYFYHRFVQHGISLTRNYGYRYKIGRFGIETCLGIGVIQSIPAVNKLKLNEQGEYENNMGIGKMEAAASFDIGLRYSTHDPADLFQSVFVRYEQKAQSPFVHNYIPVLPYNIMTIGISVNPRFHRQKPRP